MNEIYVFVGPTLDVDQARKHLQAHYLPPVARGDVYRVALRKPFAIGIIDGYFSEAPAVWHKEILWAMAQGIHVFGASSMGALRAAELSPFGMCGVGRIFEAFRDGVYEDDDEVTVIHGPASSGYRLVSEPMVNIRATLEGAVRDGIIDDAMAQHLVQLAKTTHYAERHYSTLVAAARRSVGDSALLDGLEAWLPEHKIEQKRLDAIAMLELMAERIEKDPEPLSVDFRFERTDAWEEMVRQCGSASTESSVALESNDVPTDLILDELRLLGGAAVRVALQGALARHLAIEYAQARGAKATRELFTDTLNGFFGERGLRTPEQIKTWLDEHELDVDGLTRFMEQQSYLRWASVMFGTEAERQLRDHLRTTPDYARVVRRASEKQRLLARRPKSILRREAEPSAPELLEWFFGSRGQPVPSDLDAGAWEWGFADRHALLEALRREYSFVTSSSAAAPLHTP
ncbi:MAG: TfuA-like protein [Polyangiaceae bacterium]